jgi:sensitive to high expression protein 9
MDHFQSHVFVASQRINDLTGYSGIEALRNEISRQESLVLSCRKAVKDTRAKYNSAVAKRSTTQREVNDLLHRKHAWSPDDLERFTNLYRSDHANEQAEIEAQKEVAGAETQYEEASTTLGKTILARYHEEQIWSDKIRQMSTWGTWGLMGLNVLLFVVFQILVEPWRRRRLVKGFEQKVEEALRERDDQLQASLQYGVAAIRPNAEAAVSDASSTTPSPVEAGQKVDGMADHIAGQIVDAISGTTSTTSETTPTKADLEATAETITTEEIMSEQAGLGLAFASTASGYAYYEEAFRELFSDRKLVVTQKEMTTVALEGAVGGAAVMGLLLVLLRPR